MIFDTLVNTYKFERKGKYLSHFGSFPYSIAEDEFYFLKDFIISHNLKRGYELGTGVGVSTLAAGLGFKETGGKLMSVDSYIEDYFKSDSYEGKKRLIYKSMAYEVVKLLMKDFEVPVILEMGHSPDMIMKLFRENDMPSVDYVFIDGGHYPKQIKKDIAILEGGVKGYMFFHDVDGILWEPIEQQLKRTFGATLELVMPNIGMATI